MFIFLYDLPIFVWKQVVLSVHIKKKKLVRLRKEESPFNRETEQTESHRKWNIKPTKNLKNLTVPHM